VFYMPLRCWLLSACGHIRGIVQLFCFFHSLLIFMFSRHVLRAGSLLESCSGLRPDQWPCIASSPD
jgi:hypothetical protein